MFYSLAYLTHDPSFYTGNNSVTSEMNRTKKKKTAWKKKFLSVFKLNIKKYKSQRAEKKQDYFTFIKKKYDLRRGWKRKKKTKLKKHFVEKKKNSNRNVGFNKRALIKTQLTVC